MDESIARRADHSHPEGVEAGVETGERRRRHGITRAGFYRWKNKFGGLELSDAKRLRQLEDENRRLKHMVAERAVDIRALKAAEKRGEPAGDEAGWCEMS